MLAPHFAAELLRMPPLVLQGADYLKLVALLVGGLGMLYIVSGRLNAEGFVLASLLDRPLVPPVMAVLWYLGIIPGRWYCCLLCRTSQVFSGLFSPGAQSYASRNEAGLTQRWSVSSLEAQTLTEPCAQPRV